MPTKIKRGPTVLVGPQGPAGPEGCTGVPGRDGKDGQGFRDIGPVNTQCRTATIDGVKYVWHGCYTTILSSGEKGRKTGDIRFIAGVLFVVAGVHKGPLNWHGLSRQPDVVQWTVPGNIDRPWLNKLQQAIFLS